MLCVVAPVDQRLSTGLELVRVTLPPGQNWIGPAGLTLGADGIAVTVTVTNADVSETQLPSLTSTQ